MTAATTEHPDVPCGTSWIHTPYSCPPLRINLLRPVEKPISYEHDLALSHIHLHPHRENVWKYPLFLVRPFVRRHLVFLPHQTHIAYDACIPSQNNDLRFYNRNFANGDFGVDEEFCNPWCMTHKQAVFFMRRAGHARPLHGRCAIYHTSKFAYFAFFSINCRLGSTCSPIRMLNASSARSASSILICTMTRLSGFIVVSHSWSGFISPRPL